MKNYFSHVCLFGSWGQMNLLFLKNMRIIFLSKKKKKKLVKSPISILFTKILI